MKDGDGITTVLVVPAEVCPTVSKVWEDVEVEEYFAFEDDLIITTLLEIPDFENELCNVEEAGQSPPRQDSIDTIVVLVFAVERLCDITSEVVMTVVGELILSEVTYTTDVDVIVSDVEACFEIEVDTDLEAEDKRQWSSKHDSIVIIFVVVIGHHVVKTVTTPLVVVVTIDLVDVVIVVVVDLASVYDTGKELSFIALANREEECVASGREDAWADETSRS